MMPILAAAPTPAPSPKRAGLPARVLGALVLMALATGGVFVRQQLRPGGPPHPAKWDIAVAPVVQFVETTRGLRFVHPIFVDLLSDADYSAQVGRTVAASDERSGSRAVRRSADRSAFVDALGFAAGYDAITAENTLASDTTYGIYSTTTDRIIVRGTELTPGVRVALAHELTHALQAQHFDIDLGGSEDLAVRSIAEADAMRMEQAYLASLPQAEHDQALAQNTFDTSEATQLSRVPWPMIEFRYAPYWLGPSLVAAAFARGGNGGVDALFRQPPTEVELLSPWRSGASVPTGKPAEDAGTRPLTLEMPKGVTVVQRPTSLSLMQILVMLDAWLPWSMARGSLDHWVDGRYATYRQAGGGDLCVTAAVRFDAQPDGFAAALGWWAIAAGSTARPRVEGNVVSFLACQRGAGSPNPPTPVIGPSTEIILENAAVPSTGVTDLAAAAPYLCVERALIDNPTVAPLLISGALAPPEQSVVDRARAAAHTSCG